MAKKRAKPRQEQNRALRLTFAYEGTEVQLVRAQPLRMVVAPSDTFPEQEEEKRAERERFGFWIEVSGERGRLLYRKIMHNPIRFDVEVHSGDLKEPSRLYPVEKPTGRFYAVIPDLDDARSLHIYSSYTKSGARPIPAEEIAKFDLRDIRREES